MVKTRVRMVMGLVVAALVLGLPATVLAAGIKYKATLSATPADPGAFGKAEWEFNTQTGQILLQVEVQGIATTNVALAFVNGRFVGAIPLVNGAGVLFLDNFQGDKIPRVGNGTKAEIYRPDSTLLLSGTFAPA